MADIDLEPMTEEQFQAWLPETIAGYAQEHVRTGRWSPQEAMQNSRDEHEKLLPKGLATPDQHLWNIVATGRGEPVGMLWVQVMQKPTPHAFVYYIEIYPQFRRRGYAEAAMLRLEEEAKRLGLNGIRLHVFVHNTATKPLYEKLGYVPTNISMLKELS